MAVAAAPVDPHFKMMDRLAIMGLFLAILCATPAAAAGEPSVLAPYRFQPPDVPLTTLEGDRALTYRNQLRGQLKELDLDEAQGRLDGFDRRRLLDTRHELQRMDGVVQQPRPLDLGITNGRPLPSLSPGIQRNSP